MNAHRSDHALRSFLTQLNLLRCIVLGEVINGLFYLQRFVSSLAGPVVALAGNGDHLAVVSHASTPLPSGDQVLEFMLLNVRNQKRLLAGRLPLSPASTLTWLGFTEAGSLSSCDSQVTSHPPCWLFMSIPRGGKNQWFKRCRKCYCSTKIRLVITACWDSSFHRRNFLCPTQV